VIGVDEQPLQRAVALDLEVHARPVLLQRAEQETAGQRLGEDVRRRRVEPVQHARHPRRVGDAHEHRARSPVRQEPADETVHRREVTGRVA
jgi:hypothetical protein